MRTYARRCSAGVLILFILFLFVPAVLSATPSSAADRAVAEQAGGGLLALVRSVLSILWGENGSGLEPNGTLMGDNGSGIDPDGRP